MVCVLLRERRSLTRPGQEVAASGPVTPLLLAENDVVLDGSKLCWLWWPVLAYLFWSMGYICDTYFVRTIEVISERFEIPDDVAGATLMALGCNGPELALNTIAIFSPSDIGIGAVIGGEVFNVLVIIGTAVLATPQKYMPLRIGPFSFLRDVCFYALSVGVLYGVLRDRTVERVDALLLLSGAVVYGATVASSAWLRRHLRRLRRRFRRKRTLLPHRISDSTIGTLSPTSILVGDDLDCEEEDEEELAARLEQWQAARLCPLPKQGAVFQTRVDVRNRLMDRSNRGMERYVWLRGDALMVSAGVSPDMKSRDLGHASGGMVFEYNQPWKRCWHHGGLVEQPIFIDGISPRAANNGSLYRPLLNEASGPLKPGDDEVPSAVSALGLDDDPWEVILIQDVLYCNRVRDYPNMFTLHVHRHDSELGNLITLELTAKSKEVRDAWVEALCSALRHVRRHSAEAPRKGILGHAMDWVEWFQFPVKSLAKMTIPDMDNEDLHKWFPVAFAMSTVWLAVCAYFVVIACEGIHRDFGIPTAVLGFTVAAAGTSFPNVFSGIVVSRQGKTTMAIANALGANIQNVFIALAIPWVIQTCFILHGPLTITVEGLTPAVIECGVTLLPVVLIFLCCGQTMPRWSGAVYLLTYLVYLVFVFGQQANHCATWPLRCRAGSRV